MGMSVTRQSVTPRQPAARVARNALVCALAISTIGCATSTPTSLNLGATQTGGAARVNLSDAMSTIRLPGWHLTTPRISALSYPAERLLLTSYPARRGGDCGPDSAERELPADGALIYAFEYRRQAGSPWAGLRRADFPSRPAHFALRKHDLGRYECWRVPSYLIRFRAAGRPFQVHVALGAHASSARRAQVLQILDGLRFSPPPAPPPDPPARRHALHEPVRVSPLATHGNLVSPTKLEHALRTNPNSPATASCNSATTADRRRARSFPHARRLFICKITLRGQRASIFDVEVLANGCFVAERRRHGQAVYGCIR
jgi:hypothetical protein